MLNYKSIILHWMGHASFRIEDKKSGFLIYIDPYRIPDGLPKADLILVSHSHPDHLSIEDIMKVVVPGTVVIAASGCLDALSSLKVSDVLEAVPGSTIDLPGLRVQAVPAYNMSSQFHPKNNNHVGFMITNSDGVSVYHAGDTDAIPEMARIQVDVALLPVAGKYTMDAKSAAEATKIMDVKIAVPMHYGSIIGSDDDARYFADNAACTVRILEKD